MLLRALFFVAAFVTAVSAEPVLLKVHGHGLTPVELTATDLKDYPRLQIEAVEPHAQRAHRYSGILMRELLIRCGAPLGATMRGREAHQLVVRVSAPDGYAAVFALAEFDAAFSDRTLILAEQIDDAPLPEKNGPLQLIAPGDRRGARWVRQVNDIEIISVFPNP